MTEAAIGLGIALLVFLAFQGVNLLPFLFVAALLFFVYRTVGFPTAQRRFASVGAANPPAVGITFDDIGGQESAKKELLEALDFVAQEEKVRELGIRPLKGILLTGPPGTGKTLLAKAAASYTGSVFLAASGSEFIEMYAGIGAQRVRELFRRAREMARKAERKSAIIFIDEIEVLGGKRGKHTSHLEYDQTLNQLLVEMDGISVDDSVRVLLVAATNRADLLDDALTRPGRFDRQVKVELPDREGRRHILELHTRNKPLGPDVDLDQVARETFGFSGAHLESLTNEAAILAMREGEKELSQRHFVEAIDKVIMGEKLDRRPTDEELYRVAVHESGHALVGEIVQPGSVASITITSRGSALGYVRQAPQDDRYLQTKEHLEAEIARALAGSVAEEQVFGSSSTGAAGDFQQAVDMAQRMIWAGMSRLGIVHPDTLPKALQHEVQTEILDQSRRWVRDTLSRYRDTLVYMAERLMEEEHFDGEQLRRLLREAGYEPAGETGGKAAS